MRRMQTIESLLPEENMMRLTSSRRTSRTITSLRSPTNLPPVATLNWTPRIPEEDQSPEDDRSPEEQAEATYVDDLVTIADGSAGVSLKRAASSLLHIRMEDIEEHEEEVWEPVSIRKRFFKGSVLLFVLFFVPYLLRASRLAPHVRCSFILLSILMINMADVMPLYCSSLLVPVLGTVSAVFGDAVSIKDTSTLLVARLFNSTSSMVLGALVINGVFTKCGLETRFMAWLMENFLLSGPAFLLLLMVGGTLFCAVLYSGSMVMLLALAPVLESGVKLRVIAPSVAKRILLGVAVSANAGSALLPISSPVNLITVASLDDFDHTISVHTWAAIAAPVIFLTVFCAWLVLLVKFRPEGPEKPKEEAWQEQLALVPATYVQLTNYHIVFLGVGFVAVLCVTILATKLEPIVGNPACISLGVVVVVFGSGFMSRDEFCQLDWDILFLVGGSNIMAFMVHETGLGNELATKLVGSQFVELLPYQGMIMMMVCFAMVVSSLFSHNITGVVLIPFVVAFGVKVRAAETTAMLASLAVQLGMSLPSSSFDNILSQATSETLGKRKARLKRTDWMVVGTLTSFVGALLLVMLGYHVAQRFYDLPASAALIGGAASAAAAAGATTLAPSTSPPPLLLPPPPPAGAVAGLRLLAVQRRRSALRRAAAFHRRGSSQAVLTAAASAVGGPRGRAAT